MEFQEREDREMAGKSTRRRGLLGKFIYTLVLLAFGAFLLLTAYT